MNFVHLVEKGDYKKEQLSDQHQDIITGVEMAIEYLECQTSDPDPDLDGMLIDKLRTEVEDLHRQELIERLKAHRCEMIVVFADQEAAEEGG